MACMGETYMFTLSYYSILCHLLRLECALVKKTFIFCFKLFVFKSHHYLEALFSKLFATLSCKKFTAFKTVSLTLDQFLVMYVILVQSFCVAIIIKVLCKISIIITEWSVDGVILTLK